MSFQFFHSLDVAFERAPLAKTPAQAELGRGTHGPLIDAG